MAERPDELRDRIVVEIEDDFSKLSPDEQARLTAEWIHALAQREHVVLPVSAADLVTESRAEMGW